MPAGSDAQSQVQHFSKTPVLETVGLSKVYRIGNKMSNPVADISLQVGYGDFVVIFGPSGAGKSTLLNILMGLEPPDLGQVLLKGESLYEFSDEQRTTIRLKRFGAIPANQFWLDNLSVLDNVSLPLLLQGQSLKKARSAALPLLDQVGLSQNTKNRPYELSSGQQQKASIARAIVNQPWIIFADEPTAHLDTQSAQEVLQMLVTINRERQTTVIMVTHDLQFLKHAKKWFLVQDGRLWDIKDRQNPFKDMEEAMDFIKRQEPIT